MLIIFIFLGDNQTIVLSSDDECVLTRTRDPENSSLKAHVIIPNQSVTKQNSEKELRSLSHNVSNSTINLDSSRKTVIKPDCTHKNETKKGIDLKTTIKPNAAAKTTFKPVSSSKVVIKQNLSSKTEIKPASLTKTAVKPSSSDGIYVSHYKLSDEFPTLLVYFC